MQLRSLILLLAGAVAASADMEPMPMLDATGKAIPINIMNNCENADLFAAGFCGTDGNSDTAYAMATKICNDMDAKKRVKCQDVSMEFMRVGVDTGKNASGSGGGGASKGGAHKVCVAHAERMGRDWCNALGWLYNTHTMVPGTRWLRG